MSPDRTMAPRIVTVTRSETLMRPDGRAAILLETVELGAIAFEVDQHAIGTLRRHLSLAETFLQQRTGLA